MTEKTKKESSDSSNSKSSEKLTVLVGMTGRIDSTVAAFLLKKQGYRVIGIGINLFDPFDGMYSKNRLQHGQDDYSTENLDNDPGYINKMLPHCHIYDIKKVKNVCDQLEIPFYGVNAFSIFKEKVINRATVAKLSGTNFFPCSNCHETIFRVLYEKMEVLKADFVATGHYAKLVYSKKKKLFQLVVGNDLDSDQSFYLGNVKQDMLRKTIFPLADMQKAEVQKISDSMKFDLVASKNRETCLMNNSAFENLIERTTAPTLRKSGAVLKLDDETHLMEHKGVHQFYLGKGIDGKQTNLMETSMKVVEIETSTGSILAAPEEKLKYQKFFVTNFDNPFHFDVSKPFSAFIRIDEKGVKLPCRILIKGHKTAFVELEEEQSGILATGTYVVIYNKEGASARVIGKGIVQEFKDYNSVHDQVDEFDEEENKKDDLFEDRSDDFVF